LSRFSLESVKLNDGPGYWGTFQSELLDSYTEATAPFRMLLG
jgi:hypothetical protein